MSTTETETPERKRYWWERLNQWQFVGLIVGVAIVFGTLYAIGHNDNKPTPKVEDPTMHALRTTWNGMTAGEQNLICLTVDRDGARVAARELIAVGVTASADDVETFLHVACD